MARLPVYHNQSSGVAISRINPQIDTSVSKAVGNVSSALGNLALAWKQTQDKQREQNLALERAEFQAKMKMEEDFVKRKEKEAEQREKEEEKKAREEERKLQQEELRQYREDMRRYREEAKLERQAEKAEREAEKREKEKQKALEEWKKTVNETENLSGKLAMQDRYRDITTKAKGISVADFAELKNEEKNLLNEADKVIPSVTESFTNKDNADMFALKNGAEASTAKAMIEEIFRSKYKDIASADLLKSESGNHDDYVRTGDASFKENYFADIDSARRANWLSEKEAAEMKAATNKWDKDYIVHQASQNPEGFLQALANGEIKTDGETADKVLKVAKRQKEIQSLKKEIDNYRQTQDVLAKLNDMDNVSEQLDLLENNKDVLGDKLYKSTQKAVLNAKGITAETQNDEATNIILQIASLPDSSKNAHQYYKQAYEIQDKIQILSAEGKLKSEDRIKLMNVLSKDMGAALGDLKEDEEGSTWGGLGGFGYNDAWNYLDKNYGGSEENKQKTFLDYFRKVSISPDMPSDEKKALLIEMNNKQIGVDFDNYTKIPKIGDIVDGYRFKGGNMNDENAWEKI